MITRTRWTLALTATALLLAGSPAGAQNLGPAHRGDCDKVVFAAPEEASLEDHRRCAKLWLAYRDDESVRGAYRERVLAAMNRLYAEGTARDAHEARLALEGLQVSELPPRMGPRTGARPDRDEEPRAESAPGGREGAPPAREGRSCDVPEPSRGEVRKAERSFDRGYRQYKDGDHDGALRAYLQAVEAAPGWPKGRYNAAAIHGLKGQEAESVEQLRCLTDIGSQKALDYLKMARTDQDFEPIRDRSPGFKEVTGYARIKIGNSLGEYGEDNVYNLEQSLEELGWPVSEVTEAPKPYAEPHIWFKPEAKRTVYFVMKVISHPDIRTLPIDWEDEAYDVIIAWGDTIEEGEEPPTRVRDPRDAEDKLGELTREEDRMLREPEKAAREVDDVVGTPERMTRDAKGGVDRAKKTVDKVQDTGKKVKDFGF